MSSIRKGLMRGRLRHWCLEALLATALLCSASAVAARPEGERVAVVRLTGQPDWSKVEHRLVAELEAAGFEVVLIEAEAAAELAGISEAHRTVAALRIVPGRQVTVQVVDRATGKSSQRELDARGGREPARVALQAVELLYASLLELETAVAPPLSAVPSSLSVRVARSQLRLPRARRSSSWRAAAFALAAPGGMGTMAGLEVGAALHPLAGLTVGASVAATAPAVVREGHASAWFAAGLARLVVGFEPWPLARLSPAFEVRAGTTCGLSEGESDAGEPTRLDVGSTWHGGLALVLAAPVHRDLRLRASFEVAKQLEPLQVRFAGSPAAELGAVWFGLGLGVEWLN